MQAVYGPMNGLDAGRGSAFSFFPRASRSFSTGFYVRAIRSEQAEFRDFNWVTVAAIQLPIPHETVGHTWPSGREVEGARVLVRG